MIKKIKNIMLLWKIYKKIKEAKMKDGIKTSEFWLTVISSLITILLSIEGLIPVEIMTKTITILVGVYTIARTVVKFTTTTKDDEFVEKIGKILEEKGIKIDK